MTPAGFWQRYAAWSLDAMLMLPVVAAIAWVPWHEGLRALGASGHQLSAAMAGLASSAVASGQPPATLAAAWLRDPGLAGAADALQAALADVLLLPVAAYMLVALGWSLGFERSASGATPGKRALRLRVVDERGARLAAGHVLVRFMASGLSWLLGNLGHAMAALPPRHLALHDRISGTRVVRTGATGALPAWARAWLLVQLSMLLGAAAWSATLLSAAMQAALGLPA